MSRVSLEDVTLFVCFIHSCSSPVSWQAETKAQPVQQANLYAGTVLHRFRGNGGLQAPQSSIHSQPTNTLSPVTPERAIARQKEQERRHREAVSSASMSTS